MKSLKNPSDLAGLRVTVQGLGLHGGGVATARYLARHGALVTATDLRSETVLAPSIQSLEGLPIRFVLGCHEDRDFSAADLVIKNPAVRRDNPYLAMARNIHTDISLFLGFYTGPVLGITGSKGKSSTASALHHGLRQIIPGTRLGGNITVSPLAFLDEILGDSHTPGHAPAPGAPVQSLPPVVLELSSFQLGDLPLSSTLFTGLFSGITNIHRDHQDYYGAMEPYVADKELIYQHQPRSARGVFFTSQDWGRSFARRAIARGAGDVWAVRENANSSDGQDSPDTAFSGSFYLADRGGRELWGMCHPRNRAPFAVFSENRRVAGAQQGLNLLFAAAGMEKFGVDPGQILQALDSYPGIEHRMEFCGQVHGVDCYNDSAATIPEAVLSAVQSLAAPVHLVTGGTDKNLDFSLFSRIGALPATISVLDGSAAPGITRALREAGHPYSGPHPDLKSAVTAALDNARQGEVLIFSPGCASFGMFLNEFDRGRRFKALIADLARGAP